MDLLKECNKEGVSIVMVTHDLELAGRADRIVKMKDGEIVDLRKD